jgi:hypothetical protein
MKNRHMTRIGKSAPQLKRSSAYDEDDEDPTGQKKMARMTIDEVV